MKNTSLKLFIGTFLPDLTGGFNYYTMYRMKRIIKELKDYLLPHHGNDFKPLALSKESVAVLLLSVVIIELIFFIQIFFVFKKTDFLASVLPPVMATLTNEERSKSDLAPLEYSAVLERAAQMKADDMAARGYFSHNTPDGLPPWYFFDQAGYKYSHAGENLAVNFFDSKEVAEAWMNSPTHRANVMKKDFTQIGIGVANGIFEGKNTVFVAEFFGTPQSEIKVTPPVKTTQMEVASQTVKIAPKTTKVLGETTTVNTMPEVKSVVPSESGVKLSIKKAITSPSQYVTYLFGGVSLFILLVLFVFFIKRKIGRHSVVLRGVAVLFVIILLFFVNIGMSHKVEIGREGAAKTIAY